MDKINFKNFPDTSTPLSAENINLMQNNIENGINEMQEKIKGKEIYKNEQGTTENITFSEQLEEGNLIEIIYCRKRTNNTIVIKTSGKLPFFNEMEIDLDINYFSNIDNQQSISKAIKVTQTGITTIGENSWSNVNPFGGTNVINVLQVKKYEY